MPDRAKFTAPPDLYPPPTGVTPCAFAADFIAYDGDRETGNKLRAAGEVLANDRGEAPSRKLPWDPDDAALFRAETLRDGLAQLADFALNDEMVANYFDLEEPQAAYLYHLMAQAGRRLRFAWQQLADGIEVRAAAPVWADGYHEITTPAGAALYGLAVLLDVRPAIAEAQALTEIPESEEDLPDTPEVAVRGCLDTAVAHLTNAVEAVLVAYRIAEGLEAA